MGNDSRPKNRGGRVKKSIDGNPGHAVETDKPREKETCHIADIKRDTARRDGATITTVDVSGRILSHDNSLLSNEQRITGDFNSLAGHSVLGLFSADDAVLYLKTVRKVIDTGEAQVIEATMKWLGLLVPIRCRIFKLSATTVESYNLTVGPVVSASKVKKTDRA